MSEHSEPDVVAPSKDDAIADECMAEMTGHLRRVLDLDGLDDFRRTHSLPRAFVAEYQAALVAYDRYIAHVIETEGLHVTCRAGCSACCRHELARGITPLEIVAIYALVRGWPDIEAVYESAGENTVVFQRLLHAELQRDPRPLGSDDPRVLSAHLEYNRQQRPCPFLDQGQGTCRIYPVRPLVCRWFHNLSPAQWCEPTHPRYRERDAVGIYPNRDVDALLAGISRRLGFEIPNYLAGAFVYFADDLMQGGRISTG